MDVASAVLGVAVVVFVAITQVVVHGLRVCGPDEALVLVGGRWARMPDRRGYHVFLGGGRVFVIPLIEAALSLHLRPRSIEIRIDGGAPVEIDATARFRVSSDRQTIHHAVERFLSAPDGEIERVAGETLTGHLRRVASRWPPGEALAHRRELCEQVLEEAGEDFARLGLGLDRLEITRMAGASSVS